jgi:hypothetical protein
MGGGHLEGGAFNGVSFNSRNTLKYWKTPSLEPYRGRKSVAFRGRFYCAVGAGRPLRRVGRRAVHWWRRVFLGTVIVVVIEFQIWHGSASMFLKILMRFLITF